MRIFNLSRLLIVVESTTITSELLAGYMLS